MKLLSNETELKEILNSTEERLFLYLYTPLCGTCKLAKNYIAIIEQLDGMPPIYEADINYFKELSESSEITSVPCLLAFDEGKEKGRIYAFHSVTYLYEFMMEDH